MSGKLFREHCDQNGLVSILAVMLVILSAVAGAIAQIPNIESELKALREPNMTKYAALHGMDLQIHEVRTSDDWLLEIHRVRSLNVFDPKLSSPVYLSHGFACSSFDYMSNGRNESLAFILADNGYDVWVGNYRGNRFSNWKFRDNERRAPLPEDYYRAAWQYMAERDVPAILDAIFKETTQNELYVVGQSMGTTIMFSLLSENHDYDEKILHFAALVPVTKFGEDTAPSLKLALQRAPPAFESLNLLFGTVFGKQWLASTGSVGNAWITFVRSAICHKACELCELVQNMKYDSSTVNALRHNPHFRKERAGIYTSGSAGGIAMMTAYNFAIQYNRDRWTKIDFRALPKTGINNTQEYGTEEPPEYQFTSTKVPFSLYYTENDIFTGLDTAFEMVMTLNPVSAKIIQNTRFTHQDSLSGWDARCFMYDDIIAEFDAKDVAREKSRRNYRLQTVKRHLATLDFENGCS